MSKSNIKFFNEEINYRIRNKNLIRQWIEESVKKENKITGNINIILCKDEYLHKMNIDYLNHDTFTDIITFDYSEGEIISGDLFISLDRVRENAKRFTGKIADELHRVIIHGVLHLCGYKDKEREEREEMRRKEDHYLNGRPYGSVHSA